MNTKQKTKNPVVDQLEKTPLTIKEKTIELIDDLKATCQLYGLGNDGNEYKIITQVFLYKFLNDKFTVAIKKLEPQIAQAPQWDVAYAEMEADDREELLRCLDPDILRLEPQHLISSLFNQQTKENFAKVFDDTMMDIANKNIDVFFTETVEKTKIPIFERLTQYITDDSQRSNFARALVDKLAQFSFEEAFNEHYDFFAAIFEYLLKDYNTAGGGKYAEYYTPHSIATIMARLLVGNDKDLMSMECYDPSAGTGTLLMALSHQIGENRCTIFAQDISQRSNKMLKLNLILNGLISSLDHAIQGDTLINPFFKNRDGSCKQFDFVVSNPPFKMDFSDTREELASDTSRFWGGVPKVTKEASKMAIYTLFIQHVVNSIKSGGKGAIVVPSGFLSKKTSVEGNVLKYLVKNRIVSGAIHMPTNVFANTGTNVSVLFFDKSKQYDDVILVDASNLGEDYKEGKNKKRRITNEEVNLIVDTYINRKAVKGLSAIVPFKDIETNNNSLTAGQYFPIDIQFESLTKEEFEAKMSEYNSELQNLFTESNRLQEEIMKQLGSIKYE